MTEVIRKLSPFTEFVIVIALSFGYSMLASILILLGQNSNLPFTNATLVSSLFFEIIVLFAIIQFLSIRGTEIYYRNNTTIIKLIVGGVLLFVIYYLIYYLLYYFISLFFQASNLSSGLKNTSIIDLNLFVILGFSLINSIFEEFIVVGYVIPTLSSRKSVLFAINISVLIRFLYHLYQGPMAAISIIPLGLLFALAFLKLRNIWILVVAHFLMDLLALSYYGL